MLHVIWKGAWCEVRTKRYDNEGRLLWRIWSKVDGFFWVPADVFAPDQMSYR